MLNQPIPIMISLVGGLLSATLSLLHLFPVPGLILFSYLAPLPLFLIGLGVGLRPLYGAALIGTLITFIAEGPLLSSEFLISSVLGPILLSNRALLHRKTSAGKSKWYPSSLLLKDLTHVSAFIMILGLGT